MEAIRVRETKNTMTQRNWIPYSVSERIVLSSLEFQHSFVLFNESTTLLSDDTIQNYDTLQESSRLQSTKEKHDLTM